MHLEKAATTGYHCPYCGLVQSSFVELREHVHQIHPFSEPPEPTGRIRIHVNGHDHVIEVKPSSTLHEVLHDQLGYLGTKTFCNRGACSSCTVILGGRPVLSCMTLAIECDGQEIETIEGIAHANHPLIETYIKHYAMQCGYCTSGFVVSAKALLDRNPDPTFEEVVSAIEGNLCRCGTYPQHPKAILEAAEILRDVHDGESNA